jgi:hypothetical protein
MIALVLRALEKTRDRVWRHVRFVSIVGLLAFVYVDSASGHWSAAALAFAVIPMTAAIYSLVANLFRHR